MKTVKITKITIIIIFKVKYLKNLIKILSVSDFKFTLKNVNKHKEIIKLKIKTKNPSSIQ
jgi:hypothetical protein